MEGGSDFPGLRVAAVTEMLDRNSFHIQIWVWGPDWFAGAGTEDGLPFPFLVSSLLAFPVLSLVLTSQT